MRQLALDIRNAKDISELLTVLLEGLEDIITCEHVSFVLFRDDTFAELQDRKKLIKLRTEKSVIDNKSVTLVGRRTLEQLPDPCVKKLSQAYEIQSAKDFKAMPVWDTEMETLLLNVQVHAKKKKSDERFTQGFVHMEEVFF